MILSEPSIGIESLIIAAATFEREYRYGIIYSISSIIVICDFITKNNKLHNKRELICIYQGSFFSIRKLCVCQYNSSEAIRESDSAKLISGQEKVSEIRSWEVPT